MIDYETAEEITTSMESFAGFPDAQRSLMREVIQQFGCSMDHVERALKAHFLKADKAFCPKAGELRELLEQTPRTTGLERCERCGGLGLVYLECAGSVGTMAPCSCPAGQAKREVLTR